MQSACACDILFPEAALKGITGIDYQKALCYLRKNNETPTPDVLVKGRYLEDYNTLGYLSTNVPKGSVSRHLEYTYHDWCIAQLAAYLGEREIAQRYLENSRRVWNLWRDETKSFFPRHADGRWLEGYEPWITPPEAHNDPSCYEGSTAVWSFNVFQDFPGLIARMGGEDAFLRLLDRVFDEGLFQVKETRMHLPHLYSYAGRPDLAADRVRDCLALFSATTAGLPDNEDMGCQSGFFLWHAMGLYPIYGQQHYMLTPPLFDSITARLGDGAMLHITAERRGEGKYIHACYLGEEELQRAWVTHEELLRTPRLHFVLADEPSSWGRHCPPPQACL